MTRLLTMLVLIASLSACKNDDDPLRLDHAVEPVSQRITLSLNPEMDTYSGSVEIKIRVNKRVSQFRLQGRELAIEEIRIQGDKIDERMEFIEGEKGTITASVPFNLSAGNYALEITFTNEFSRQGTGIYKVVYEDRNYLFTQMEPEYARDSFPCWDAPEFKIPWELQLIIPTNFTAYANTPIRSERQVKSMKEVVFKPTKPMPSYLVALAIGEFESIPITDFPISGKIIVPKGKLHLADEARSISPLLLQALEDYFGIPYPYAKLDQIAVPEFNFGAMENVGLITYRDTALLRDPKSITLGQKQGLASIIAHEMSHMWFGNLVTPKWWDDLWLNESFASWIALKMVNRTFPEYEMGNNDIGSRQRAMNSDSLSTTKPIRRPIAASDAMAHLFDSLAYNKGMAVLDMIESWMGEETFRRGMVKYMNDYAWSNTDAFDLASSLSDVVESDMLAIMKSFVTQAGIPLLEIEQISSTKIRIIQKRYAHQGVVLEEDPKWMIPVVLKYGDKANTHVQKVLLTKRSQTFNLNHPAEWLYPNAAEKGYYRWKLSSDALLDLSAYVRELGIRNRMGFISNLAALFAAGELDAPTYLKTLASFSEDASPEVRQSVVKNLTGFSGGMIPPELKKSYGRFLATALKPMLSEIGIEKQDNEAILIEKLRPALINALGWHCEDPEILKFATEQANAYMADPYSVDPSLAQSYLRLAAFKGNERLYDAYTDNYESATEPTQKNTYLKGISGVRDPELMNRALAYVLTDAVPPHLFGSIPYSLTDNDANRERVCDWLMENYSAIQEKVPEQSISYLPWLACGQSQELLEKVRNFLLAEERKTQGMEIEFAKAKAVVTLNERLRKKELENVRRFLETQ